MKGDFTRDSFHPIKHFSRVLSQQGRVTVDADANEQSAILLHMLRQLARDLIGPYAAPRDEGGFTIVAAGSGGFTIEAGRYYVDGILVENDADCSYGAQPDWPVPADDPLAAWIKAPVANKAFWLYLDVWERLITSVEDSSIREKALGGPDTAARAKVVWQVKGLPIDPASFTRNDRAYGLTAACAAPLGTLTRSAPPPSRRGWTPERSPTTRACCRRMRDTAAPKTSFIGSRFISAAPPARRPSNGRATTVAGLPPGPATATAPTSSRSAIREVSRRATGSSSATT